MSLSPKPPAWCPISRLGKLVAAMNQGVALPACEEDGRDIFLDAPVSKPRRFGFASSEDARKEKLQKEVDGMVAPLTTARQYMVSARVGQDVATRYGVDSMVAP
eukprot:354547-Chlamydomonas_euryale.AAC.1